MIHDRALFQLRKRATLGIYRNEIKTKHHSNENGMPIFCSTAQR